MNQFAKPGLAEEKLPPVSTVDNGKVLGVNNGVWDKVAASGGSDLPEVTSDDKDKYLHTNSSTGDLEWSAVSGSGGLVIPSFTESDGSVTCDLTFSQISAAVNAGTCIMAKEICEGGVYGFLNLYQYIPEQDVIVFSFVKAKDGDYAYAKVIICTPGGFMYQEVNPDT